MSPHQLSTRFFTEQETKTTLFTEALTNDSDALNTVLSDSRRLRRVSKKNSRNKPNDTTSSTRERWYTSIRSVYPFLPERLPKKLTNISLLPLMTFQENSLPRSFRIKPSIPARHSSNRCSMNVRTPLSNPTQTMGWSTRETLRITPS